MNIFVSAWCISKLKEFRVRLHRNDIHWQGTPWAKIIFHLEKPEPLFNGRRTATSRGRRGFLVSDSMQSHFSFFQETCNKTSQTIATSWFVQIVSNPATSAVFDVSTAAPPGAPCLEGFSQHQTLPSGLQPTTPRPLFVHQANRGPSKHTALLFLPQNCNAEPHTYISSWSPAEISLLY